MTAPHEKATEAVSFQNKQANENTFLFSLNPNEVFEMDEEKPPRHYTLRATVSNETIAFAERPARSALAVSTQDFVKGFEDELFVTSNPNGAITFVSEDTASSSAAAAVASLDGPLIAVLSEPEIVGTSPDNSTFVIEYNITQSDSQRAIVSIEKFIDTTFYSCSIFIDGTYYPYEFA